MKFEKWNIRACLLVSALLIVAGCEKKAGESGTPQSPAGTPSQSQPQAQTPAQAPAQTQPAPVEIEKPVADIQAQAKTMSVDSLKATALKYKEAILAKQADLEKLTAKIKEIPIADALGQEAKTLKTDLSNLEASLKALKDRFQVYYDTLKEKGGDLAGLALQ